MIEQAQQCIKVKKTSKKPKKPEHKIVEEQPQYFEKIQEQGKEISEMSEPDQQEDSKRAAINLYELLEDFTGYLILDHEEFKQEIQESLETLKKFDMQKINHKQIMAYSLLAKVLFIEKKLAESSIDFDKQIVEKQKEKLREIFKAGIRAIDFNSPFYKLSNGVN